MNSEPIVVFILSYNRPLYLWACLDSLYRTTTTPARFILADNASSDPLCREVIHGFERRGMFYKVHLCEDNLPDRLPRLIEQYRSEIGEFFGFVESDVLIEPSPEGWLETMVRLMREHPKLMMLGSHIDKRDFVDPEFARSADPKLSPDELVFLIKAQSPERQPVDAGPELIEPHNPPGRLLLFRSSILDSIQVSTDYQMYCDIVSAGFESKIATGVVHRHLSLLNFYDYRDYDRAQRDGYFTESNRLARSKE